MFKKHWKTPFRDSHFNIRPVEKIITAAENNETYASFIPEWDDSTELGRKTLLNQQPQIDDLKMLLEDGQSLDSEDMLSQIWACNEQRTADVEYDLNNYNPGNNDLDEAYNPVQQLQMDREWTGMESDARMRMIQNEMELVITEKVGAKQIREG